MATLGKIGGAEPSTLTFELRTVTFNQNSTTMHAEILVLGDPDTTNALAAVVAGIPGSTAWGLVVRTAGHSSVTQGSTAWQVQVTNQIKVVNSTAADFLTVISGNSTVAPLAGSVWSIQGNSTVAPLAGSTWATRPIQSSAADLQMTATPLAGSTWNTRSLSSSKADFLATVYQSTAADLNVTVAGYSTIVSIAAVAAGAGKLNIGSTAADNAVLVSGNSTVAPLAGSLWTIQGNSTVAPLAGSTWATRPIQSSATDLRTMSVTMDGTSNTIESSTRAVGTNSTMRGLAVRQLMPAFLTTASSNVFASTTWTIATSNAATIQYVYAYSITTTNQTPTKIGFYAGSTLVWPLVLAAISSAVSGVNLAVSPPAYLFAGSTGAILQMKTAGSTGLGFKAGVSYWVE